MWSQARTYELCFAATDLQELNRSLWDLFFPLILFSSAASFVRVFAIFFFQQYSHLRHALAATPAVATC